MRAELERVVATPGLSRDSVRDREQEPGLSSLPYRWPSPENLAMLDANGIRRTCVR